MQIGTKNFDFTKHTYIMGILNVTPDSFLMVENLILSIKHYFMLKK